MKKRPINKLQSIKLLWWVIGAVIVTVVGVVTFYRSPKYSPEQQIGKINSGSEVNVYLGNGYEISTPKNWQLDESEQEAPAVIFTSPDKSAKVYIQPQYDPRLTSGGETALIKNLYDAFKQNPDYSITSTQEAKVNGNAAFLVEGTFKEQEKQLEFQEYTFFGESGDFYSVRINNEPGQQEKALDNIVGSFKITGPNPDEMKARNLVEKVAEVIAFQKLVEKGDRSTFGVRVDRTPTTDELYFIVQVYEIFPDHTTTFNWYRVNPKTWLVERQDLATDTWKKVQ